MAFYGSDGGAAWRDGVIGLGSVLRFVTPEDAFEFQPLSQGGRRVMVAAARLDNREELAAQLGISSHEARSLPDSALIFRAHEKWGEACVDQLSGDWCFAVWNAPDQRLLVARDHHGNTGLYWHRDGKRLVFATSLKALLALPDLPKRPDLFKVAQTLVAWRGDGIRTSYEDIQSLPPAHLLRVSRSGVEVRRYWFPEHLGALSLRGDEEYLEQFLEIYGSAVKARLRSAKPVGATLSAGLDSGSVVALAGPLLAGRGSKLEAFTAVPRFEVQPTIGPRLMGNEWELAHATASMAGVAIHLPVAAEGAGILGSLQRQVEIHDGPGLSGANYHWMLALLELARERGLGVLLTGQQGNATVSFNGKEAWFWSSLFHGDIREAWLALSRSEPNPWLGFRQQMLRPIFRPAMKAVRRQRALKREVWLQESALSPELSHELNMAERMNECGHDPTFANSSQAENLLLLGLGQNAVGALWHELGAAHGLEIRDPTADRRIVEFCLRLPGSQSRIHGQPRMLLRKAMTGRMPDQVLQMRAQGLQAADLGLRVLAERPALTAVLENISSHPLASRCLAFSKMSKTLADLRPANAAAAYEKCGCILLRGLNAGLFLRRF